MFHSVFICMGEVYCFLVKSGHAFHQFRETLFIIQGMRLGVDAGYLDGDIVNIRSFQCFQVMIVTVICFPIA